MRKRKKIDGRISVGFVIQYPFQFYVFKNVYKHMVGEAEFIVDMSVFFPVTQPDELREAVIALLERHGAAYRVLEYGDAASKDYMLDFLGKYRGLVSLWERGCVTYVKDSRIKKIHMMYGCGKELNFVRPSHGIYDLCLAFGKRGNELLSYYTRSEIVGNAKFDDWFAGEVDDAGCESVFSGLDESKKTILYLPTHSDLCSIDFLAQALKRLVRNYNVIIKLHYFTVREEPDRIRMLSGGNLFVLSDDIDLLPLLRRADMVISDNSSAIFDAILADKPVLVVDFLDTEYLDTIHKNPREYRRGSAGAATYSGSIEQRIKKEGRVVVLTDASQLEKKVLETLEDSPKFRRARQEIIAEHFSFNDGHCGNRAAVAIRACLAESYSLENRPILYHSFEAYRRNMNMASFETQKSMSEKIDIYEHLLTDPGRDKTMGFSVIVFDRYPEKLAETLKSFIWQRYPHERYEILIVTEIPESELIEIMDNVSGKKRPRYSYVFFDKRVFISSIFQTCIRKARNEHVLFSYSGCVVNSDFILQYALWFERMPGVLGIGGYERLLIDESGYSLSEYGFYTIARQLGNISALPYGYIRTVYLVENDLFCRNPFGSLANVVYKRSFLETLYVSEMRIHSWQLLEDFLKYSVMKKSKVVFAPLRADIIVPESLIHFRERCFEEGFSLGMLPKSIQSEYGYQPLTLVNVLLETVSYFFQAPFLGKKLPVRVVFFAAFFRYIGNSTAKLRLFSEKMRPYQRRGFTGRYSGKKP